MLNHFNVIHSFIAVLCSLCTHIFAYWQFRMSVSELSMDILLFVIGKLDLAGPYAIKTSTILANCCKVLYFILL